MSFGWVLRNDKGAFMAAVCQPWTGNFSPKEEAMAVRETLSWLKQNNYENILIETDSLLVVQGINSASLFSSFDLLLIDIKDFNYLLILKILGALLLAWKSCLLSVLRTRLPFVSSGVRF